MSASVPVPFGLCVCVCVQITAVVFCSNSDPETLWFQLSDPISDSCSSHDLEPVTDDPSASCYSPERWR